MTYPNITLIATTTCTALMAGLFFSFSCSVMLGLKLLPDSQFITSMQSINKAIQNPIFFIVFFGTLLLLPINSFIHYSQSAPIRFWLFFAASAIYLLDVFCVTVLGNIPLNDTLDKFSTIHASEEAIRSARINFEVPWNRLNTIRTISSFLCLVIMLIGCVYTNKD